MARGYRNLGFHWNGKSSTVIENLGFGADLNREAAEILYRYAEQYTPYDKGLMSRAVRITGRKDKGMITYTTWYAKFIHEGITPRGAPVQNWTRRVHPKAQPFWEDAAWRHHKRAITREVDAARLKYRSFNY